MEKKFKYLVCGEVIEWVDNNIIEKWKKEEVVIAINEYEAVDLFVNNILKGNFPEDCKVDVDDIWTECIGPADVFLSATIDAYITGILDTVTVGKLIEILQDNFDADSKIYLANYYSDRVPVYGGITEECFKYEDDDR